MMHVGQQRGAEKRTFSGKIRRHDGSREPGSVTACKSHWIHSSYSKGPGLCRTAEW